MQRFELCKHHIAVMAHLNMVKGSAYPTIDPKRPFGNGDVQKDLLRMIAPRMPEDVEEAVLEAMWPWLTKEVEAIGTAIEVVTHTRSFVPGVYEAADYSSNWKLVK